jgi:hypothetical protein
MDFSERSLPQMINDHPGASGMMTLYHDMVFCMCFCWKRWKGSVGQNDSVNPMVEHDKSRMEGSECPRSPITSTTARMRP